MWLSLKQGSLQLDGDAPLAFRQARGYWVCCVDGQLWLTIAGQPGDHLLAAGDRVRIDSNGLALISGLPTGTLRLYREASWPLRSAHWLLQAWRGFRPRPAARQRLARVPLATL